MNFEYRENSDGTFALYNTDVEDIYFSNIGAYREAIEKFVLPSNVENFNNKKIKILDVCYGMGFNSKSFLDYCLKNNYDFEFEIDAIEIDKKILALSLLILDEHIHNDVHFSFGQKLLNQINLDKNIEEILGENWIKYILQKFEQNLRAIFTNSVAYLYQKNILPTFLHNIYYQNQLKINKISSICKINFILDDLLKIIPNLNTKYDLIFHDAFSIRKQPELWDEFVMSNYYRILNDGGKFLTYSNSRVLRRTLENIGFKVEINYLPDGKQNGTIGIKI